MAAQMLLEHLREAIHAAVACRVSKKAWRGMNAQEQKSSRTMSKGVRLWDYHPYYRVDSSTKGRTRTQREPVNAGWLALRRDEDPPPAAAEALVWPGGEERFDTQPFNDEELIDMVIRRGVFKSGVSSRPQCRNKTTWSPVSHQTRGVDAA